VEINATSREWLGVEKRYREWMGVARSGGK